MSEIGHAGLDVVEKHNNTAQTPIHGGPWVALQCASGTIRLLSASSNTGDDLGETFMEMGEVIYGNFTSVVNHTDSTGVLLAYRG